MTQLDARSAAAERVPRDPEHALARERGTSARWWSLLVVVAVVSGVAIWVTSPRFAIDGPSLVDDWAAIERSPDQLSDVARLSNPEQQRFRPGWIVWNYLQWHTFDAPQGMIGPNAWNVARTLIFVAGLSLLTLLALPRPRGPWEAALYSGIAGIPPLLVVVTVPKFARDLARFGNQEPLLVGGMALGGSLLVLAARRLLAEEQPVPRWSTAALGVAGSALWILGVYQKETSVCVLPLLAAVVLVGRTRLAGWRRLSAARRRLLGALAAIVLVPLAHVTVEIVRITVRGDLVYDAEVDSGRGVARGLATLWDWTHEVFPPRARQIVLAAIVLTALATLVRRRHNAVAVAALGSGFLTLVFAAQSGVAVSRYYLPAYALALVALSLSLGRLPRLVQVVGVLVAVLAFVPPASPRDEVSGWAAEEQEGTALVRTVARLESSGCPVAAGGLDLETSMALPVLVRLERGDVRRTCDSGDTYVVVRRYEEGLLLLRACAPGALEPVRRSWIADVYRCTQLRRQPVRHPELGLVEPERLVTMHRLRA